MNRKIHTLIATGVILLGASACTPQQIARVIDYSDTAVVTDVRPVERITDSPVTTAPECEGAYRPGVYEGASNAPVPCDAPPVLPTLCEGDCGTFNIGDPAIPAPRLQDEGVEGAHR